METLQNLTGGRGSLIATDALEAALVGLIKTVQRQQRDIEQLKRELGEAKALSSAVGERPTVAERLQSMEAEIAALRKETSVSVPSPAAADSRFAVDERRVTHRRE